MDRDRELRADCLRCVGLCCVALAFDRSVWFAFDKPPNVPCRYLLATDRCAVHDALAEVGLAGCAQYDCYGAGQRVTQELFPARTWREHPDLARAMLLAFAVVRRVHELVLLLREAGRLPLWPAHEERRQELLGALEPPAGWTAESVAQLDIGQREGEVHAFLRSLRGCLTLVQRRRRRLPLMA